jgi:hypothetical protein
MAKHLLLGLALAIALTGCSAGEGDAGGPDNICGQEPCYEGPFEAPWISAHDYGLEFWAATGALLTNDNRVLETEHLLIYSDASEDWAKIEMGRTGEEALALIMGLFQVTPEELGIVDMYSRIEVYSMRRLNNIGTVADINGYINWAHDTTNSSIDPSWVLETAEHECTHTVQFRLGGTYSVVWCWFTEGLAEAVSDGGMYPPLRCWPEVEAFRNRPNSVNPVSVRVLEDIPDWTSSNGAVASVYYPLFGLAVRWLLDPNGHGKTCIDVKQMFRDIAGGMDFFQAFQTRMGISMESYRDHFYGWMEGFLPDSCD